MKPNKASLAIIALICGIYVIGPDPFPILIDDIIVGLVGAANVLKLVSPSKKGTSPRLHD